LIINYARRTLAIKASLATRNAGFNGKKTLFPGKLDLSLTKKVEFYVWNTAFYGAETWGLRKVEQKYLESFEMRC
jgi:hypothetical protein